MNLNEYLIENAFRQAQINQGPKAAPRHVVGYLIGSKQLDAADEYLQDFEFFDDLSKPFIEERA